MPGLVPGIHVFTTLQLVKTWMAGTSPAMTIELLRNASPLSFPRIAVQRSACFRTPMSRASRLVGHGIAFLNEMAGTSPAMTVILAPCKRACE